MEKKENCNNIDLLCVGNALVDVFMQDNRGLAEKYALTEPVQHVEYEKITGLLREAPDYLVCSGGGAANVAKLSALLGSRTAFIGAIGRDTFGSIFANSLESAGVRNFLLETDAPTGLCVFLERKGKPRALAACPSAATELGADDVCEEAVQAARIAVIDGFLLDRTLLIEKIFDLAGEYGTVLALDLGSAEMSRKHGARVAAYCQEYPLFLFMNQEEAEVFCTANIGGLNDEPEQNILEKLLRVCPLNQQVQAFFQKMTADDIFPVVVVKLASKGAVVFSGGKARYEPTLELVPQDATGAGDAFCAGFLRGYLMGKSFAGCAALGNHTAREVLGVNGTLVDKNSLSYLDNFAKLL